MEEVNEEVRKEVKEKVNKEGKMVKRYKDSKGNRVGNIIELEDKVRR